MGNRQTIQKLDLPKLNMTSLELAGWFAHDERVAAILSLVDEEDETAFIVDQYSRSTTPHTFSEYISMESGEDRDPSMYFSVEYDLAPDQITLNMVGVSGPLAGHPPLLDILDGIGPISIRRQVNMAFEVGEETDALFFPLPLRYPEPDVLGSPWPMDELRGIRGVRFDPHNSEQIYYSFILDRPLNATAFLRLDFLNAVTLGPHLIDQTVSEAQTVASSMGLEVRKQRPSRRKSKNV